MCLGPRDSITQRQRFTPPQLDKDNCVLTTVKAPRQHETHYSVHASVHTTLDASMRMLKRTSEDMTM